MFKTRPKAKAVHTRDELVRLVKDNNAQWNSVDVDSELGKQLTAEAKENKGVVRFEKEKMTAVRPALPESFNAYRKKLRVDNSGVIPTTDLRDHVRGYLIEVETEVEKYLPESVNLDEAIDELNELSPLEWSAKYGLPLLLTACTQHFAMVEMLEDERFREHLLKSWEEHKRTHPQLNRPRRHK